ncbi:uncharacterized protein LOC123705567 [Colias croceus]|uniref:uncharacterized protein LOC123705567 n=1 Tax=Colias crocea TaxID=72248 RepID=UPI001E280D10|nr:uncharacterized protein LOC123705567 [Colias croceus]
MANRNQNSLDVILTYDNRNMQSDTSVVVSTSHIPGMDNAAGSGARHGPAGRSKLRYGSLALGAFLTMHCRVAASALTGGFFLFILFLVTATASLANPMRHFEVYLGQWSISGPGRAFRIIPMLDGIGIAICINTLIRAINCCTIAAIAAIYVLHSISDSKLPFTYCRDFDLKPYDPVLKDISTLTLRESRFSLSVGEVDEDYRDDEYYTVGTDDFAWRNASFRSDVRDSDVSKNTHQIQMCKEEYSSGYPTLYSTPAYNFFYVEVASLRTDYNFGQFNMPLVLSIVLVWISLWLLMISERLAYGRLIWNNMQTFLLAIPWIWSLILVFTAVTNLASIPRALRRVYRIGVKEIFAGIADALEVALYIHSASTGTELIHGKGLNHYASGHIDPHLNSENVWHSGLLLLLTGLHSSGAAVCALVDYIQPNTKATYNMRESTLWIIPMYSKCVLICNYSHFMSVLIFSGLALSYMTVAYMSVKTALHTIFEYKVKLVFAEQVVVAGTILSCMSLSLLYATTGGLALLESVDAIMTGISMPFVCLLELIAMLYVYRSHDFVSDMNIATEENACSTRIDAQWQIIPFVTFATILMKASALSDAEMPHIFMFLALVPLAGVMLSVPTRACVNVYRFIKSGRRTRN